MEINDAPGRANYVQGLIEQGYPIYSIEEKIYSDLANNEEGNLYKIVLASTRQLGRIRSYYKYPVEFHVHRACSIQEARSRCGNSCSSLSCSSYTPNTYL